MNGNSGKQRLLRYYKFNMPKILLIALLCGVIFTAIHVITRSFDSEKFTFNYKASIKAEYELREDQKEITVDDCWSAIQTDRAREEIKAYLGSYVTYEEYINNLEFQVEKGTITTYYTDTSQVRAKRIVNTVSGKISTYFYEQDKVRFISKKGKTDSEQVKVMGKKTIKFGITHFTEMGVTSGFVFAVVLFGIIYLCNNRIKNKADIEDELNLVVLASIPYTRKIMKE